MLPLSYCCCQTLTLFSSVLSFQSEIVATVLRNPDLQFITFSSWVWHLALLPGALLKIQAVWSFLSALKSFNSSHCLSKAQMPQREAGKTPNTLALNFTLTPTPQKLPSFTSCYCCLSPSSPHGMQLVVKYKPVTFGCQFCHRGISGPSQKAQPVCRETVQTFIQMLALKCLGTWKQHPTS